MGRPDLSPLLPTVVVFAIVVVAFFGSLASCAGDDCTTAQVDRYTILHQVDCAFSLPVSSGSDCDATVRQVFKILSVTDNQILLGSTECLYTLDLQLKHTASVNMSMSDPTNFCISMTGDDSDFVCKNYISVGFEKNSTTFQVCGTNNAFDSLCWTCTKDGKTLSCDNIPVETEYMPKDPDQNVTVLLDGDVFFIGGFNSRTESTSTVAVAKVSRTSGSEELRSEDDYAMNPPVDFVGEPIEYEGFMYFFFRERAIENHLENRIYSRVARICKDDAGGITSPLLGDFTTFLKTRLVCSCGNAFPFFYDEIQDVQRSSSNTDIIHAVFTTPNSGVSSSAICRYSMSELNDLFNSDVRRGQTSDGLNLDNTKAWNQVALHVEDTLTNRNCSGVYDFRNNAYYYLQSFPLMNTNAPNCGLGTECTSYQRESDSPLAVLPGVRAQRLLVVQDSEDELTAFLGTNNQSVYHIHINSSQAVVRGLIHVNSATMTSEDILNKWPYGINSLEEHADNVYGTTDNCAFTFPSSGPERYITERSHNISYTYATKTNPSSVIYIFKTFEAPTGTEMRAIFSGELREENCTVTRFEDISIELLQVTCAVTIDCSDGMCGNCSEAGRVQCASGSDMECWHVFLNDAHARGEYVKYGNINITGETNSVVTSPCHLEVDVPIYIDCSPVNERVNKMSIRHHDKDTARYTRELADYLQHNTTCSNNTISTCPSGADRTTCTSDP